MGMKREPKLDRLCAVVAAPTAKELARQLRQALRFVRTVELRLDWLRGETERRQFLDWLAHRRIRAQLIATCRRRRAGGSFPGSVAAQRAVLEAAIRAGCRWYDIEIESIEASARGFQPLGTERACPSRLRSRHSPLRQPQGRERLVVSRVEPSRTAAGSARAIVSLHRFGRAPADPATLLRRFRIADGAIWKLAIRCRGLHDALRLLRLTSRHPMIAVPMGREALPARMLSLRAGSLLTYAAVNERTAPGQPSLEEAKLLYHADSIDWRTRVYGVIGDRAGHSISPAMHNAAFQAHRMNAVYLPFPVTDLTDFLAAIEPLGIRGFSVTIPHKQAIVGHLDACDVLAKRLGAVNTVVVRRGKLFGYNTDYLGVLRALEDRVKLRGCRALVLGAGGAARAAAFALADSGSKVWIWARRPPQARALARLSGAVPLERRLLRRRSFELIVNATAAGMEPDAHSPLVAAELNAAVVFDMVYRPLETQLLRLAASRGLQTVSGLEMLVAQGAAQWELWTGRRAPEGRMRRAAVKALGEPKKLD